MKKSSELLALYEDLCKKFQQLRSLVEHPGLFIVDFFFSLRNEIDYDTENLLIKINETETNLDLGKRNIDGEIKDSANCKKCSCFNQARQHIIDELNRYQTISLGLTTQISKSHLTGYRKIQASLEKFCNENVTSLYNRETVYESIAREIKQLEDEIKRILLSDRTFYYFKSKSAEVGVLFILEDFYLNENELECLNYIKITSDNSGRTRIEDGAGEVLKDVILHLRNIIQYRAVKQNEGLLTKTQSSLEIKKSSFVLWNFYKYQRNLVNQLSIEPEAFEPSDHVHTTNLCKIAEFVSSPANLPRNAQQFIKLYSNLNLDELSLSVIEDDALQYFLPNTVLNQINLTCNCLTSLSNKQFDNVCFNKLDLTSNYLEEIPEGLFGKNLDCLTQLNLSSNFLKSVAKNAFLELENIQTLSLSHNLLQFNNDKDQNFFKNLYKLTRLYLQSNLIDELPSPNVFTTNLSEYRSLIKLDISENRIRYLPCDWSCFIVLPNLEILNLSSNKIAYLCAKMFKYLKNIKILDLSFNLISRVEDGAFVIQDNLIELNLSNNQLEYLSSNADLFSDMNGVKKLDLSFNRLGDLSSLKNLKNTCTLNLESNTFSPESNINFNSLINLKNLTLAGCQLKALKNSVLSNASFLSELDLKKNSLQKINDESLLTGPQPELRKLYLNSNKIESIDPKVFKQFKNLVCLNLSSNEISHLTDGTFDDLNHLQVLDLSKNNINRIDPDCFKSLKCLVKLFVSENQLTSLQFLSHLVELKDVILSDNKIGSLSSESFSSLARIQNIDLSNNCLQDIDETVFGHCARLMNLKLAGNTLKSFETRRLSQELHWLDFSSNKFETLTEDMFHRLANLETLKLNQNNIRTIHPNSFRGLESLKKLDISDNILEHLESNTFSSLTSLKSLCIGGNRLTSPHFNVFIESISLESIVLIGNEIFEFRELNDTNLPFFTQVTKLDFSTNKIESFGDFKMGTCFPNLKSLTLTQNNIKLIKQADFQDLANLIELDLSHNELHDLQNDEDLFASLTHLEILKLNNNGLKAVNRKIFRKLHKLRKLDLSGNYLANLDEGLFCNLAFLECLNLSDNQLVDVTIQTLLNYNKQLKRLNLSRNQLDNSSINTQAFNSSIFKFELAFLDLSFNKIKDPSFIGSLYGLNELKLNNNLIEHLAHDLFDKIKYLYELDLSHNMLKTIERRTFENMMKLEEVNLAFNRIETTEPSALKDLIRLKRINLEGNPVDSLDNI